MPVEIERKFLVVSDAWRPLSRSSQRFCQGYLSHGPGPTVRARRSGPIAFVTVKGEEQAARPELEYEIPVEDAEAMLASLCRRPLVEKTRHEVWHAGLLWQVDEFRGGNDGLVLAEVELAAVDQPVELPARAGREVTDNPEYRNSELSRRPMRERAVG
jgi:CYTH domain-containing protein